MPAVDGRPLLVLQRRGELERFRLEAEGPVPSDEPIYHLPGPTTILAKESLIEMLAGGAWLEQPARRLRGPELDAEACTLCSEGCPRRFPRAGPGELGEESDLRLRRLGLAGLVAAAAPENGWTAKRRARLKRYEGDGSAEVVGAAAFVFPPPV